MDSEGDASKFGRGHFYFGSQGMLSSIPLKRGAVPSEFYTLTQNYNKMRNANRSIIETRGRSQWNLLYFKYT